MRTHKVFVYGTLKSGQHANGMMQSHGEMLCEGSIHGRLLDLGAFPAYIAGDDGEVFGEVWQIDSAGLSLLDRYEGEGSLYRRIQVNVKAHSGEHHEAFAYEYLGDEENGEKVASGSWHRRF